MTISVRVLVAALVALFAVDNVLLLGLLGVSPVIVAALGVVAPAALFFLTWRSMAAERHVAISTILCCLLVAAILLVLGGEGRLVYATADWQIRDAVLADMGSHRWPFDYWLEGKSQMLRAPVGMYLVPALLGGASQLGRDWALLAHNGLILTLIFAIGSTLFDGRRARLIALFVFVMFSGLDIIGNLIVDSVHGQANWRHIERWANNYQFSAHITQIFWVPQHAFAGWTVALAYLLWRRNLAPVGLFAASLPLVAIWSPLVLFGALPFAAFAGLQVLRTGKWHAGDLLVCGIAAMLAVPALLYLSADAMSVATGLRPPPPLAYILIMLLEVLPFLVPLLFDRSGGTDRATMLIAGLCLFLMPLWTIGASTDFQMRASIMPLALVALAFGGWAGRLERIGEKAAFLAIMGLGSLTGAVEIANAVRLAPSPVPLCHLPASWDRQTGLVAPYATYFAARDAMPFHVDPVERVDGAAPATCWDHPWQMPRGGS